MEKKRCSSQKLKQSGSCAVYKGPDGRGVASESSDSAAGKKRKKKNKAPAKVLETAGEAPPPSFICRQESTSRQTKKQYPGGSHCSSELSSNSGCSGKYVATGATATSSSSSLETSKPPSKTTRVSEQPPCSKSPSGELKDVTEDGLHSRDSLRWGNQFSDEERERERIEEYKKNRRKRYTKQFRVLQQTSHPSPFYTPSESLS